MHKVYLTTGIILAGLVVVLGAFAAHGLKKISPDSVPVFQTGVQYQMYHAFALILLAIIFEKLPVKWLAWAGVAFIIGVILFSGSLYILSFLKAAGKPGLGSIGIITPIGGLAFILGWLFFLIGILK